jgi:serine protease
MNILLPLLFILLLAPSAIEARQFPVKKGQPDPHRFIVSYKNEEGKANVHTVAEKCHTDLGPQHAIAATLSSEACEGLRNNSNIEYVERDYPRYLTRMRGYDSNDLFKPHLPNNTETHDENHRKLTETVPYGISMVQADQISYDSSNPRTVCIIDSGYDLGHEDLPSTNVDGFSFGGNFPWSNFPWNQDGAGHGTHVAGRSPINIWGLFDTPRKNMKVSQI